MNNVVLDLKFERLTRFDLKTIMGGKTFATPKIDDEYYVNREQVVDVEYIGDYVVGIDIAKIDFESTNKSKIYRVRLLSGKEVLIGERSKERLVNR